MSVKQIWIVFLSLTMFTCGGGGTDGGDIPDGAGADGDAAEFIYPDVQGEETLDDDETFADMETVEAASLTECSGGAECPTGFCVDAPDGKKYCAIECYEDCPQGWTCKGVLNIQNDLIFICLPLVQRLCRPCMENEDCRPKDVATNDL
ncbi:MAG: hypothetical protein FJ088_09075, partial [Deltaproteobacteria bacterium]|nr:hypothetical protein [Deltaproteobacteria bacterium]